MPSQAEHSALHIIQAKGGLIRVQDALQAGIHPDVLKRLCSENKLEQLTRGVYALADVTLDTPPLELDFITICKRSTKAVICLESALQYYDITTQLPRFVHIALVHGSYAPNFKRPAVQVHHFSKASYAAGVETVKLPAGAFRIYSPEKTLADCFKFRNELGMDVVKEALEQYRYSFTPKIDLLLQYAKVCRVETVMRPYIDAVLT